MYGGDGQGSGRDHAHGEGDAHTGGSDAHTGGTGSGAGARRVVDGRFELLERLGSGGMGTVWRARDLALHREVALKEMRPPDPALSAADPTASRKLHARVLREARALARISHPNVVTIHHIVDGGGSGFAEGPGDPDGSGGAGSPAGGPSPWLVMELLPGQSLQQRLDQGPLGYREAARTGRQVLAGLRAAHAAGIHHRDVKPANVMLRPDTTGTDAPADSPATTAVLTDFGIASLVGASPLTMTGEFIGSPEYIAPERIRGAPDAPAADLWSLGMLLYVAVEGLSPMRRDSTLATLAAVLDDPVPPPRLAGPLGGVLAQLLVRDPAARPDAARLDALLAAAEAGHGPEPSAPTPPLPLPLPTRLDSPLPPPPGPYGEGPAQPRPYGEGPAQPPVPPSPPSPPWGAGQSPPPYALATVGPRPRTAPDQPAAAARSRRTASAVAACAVALALLGVGVYLFTGEDGTGPGSSATGSAAPAAQGDAPAVPGASGSGSVASGGPRPTVPGSRQASAPPSGSVSATTGVPSASATPVRPVPPPAPPGPAGHWIAQLHSEPVTSSRAAVDARLAAVRRQVPEAAVLRSDDYASLRAGYWVIYAPGPYRSGRAALANCALRGRLTANECVGRWLSDEASDRVYLCSPPARAPKGRCTRP
ncbi:serine/threonine-protein kinase [Streptomyces sp. NPDC058657]|uniref:serine/threonine-protein kinase n=1 Tax=unclassified Streptomyces TaxID=2593676 RepID=UPI003660AA97